jgi:hypothetical protein
VIRVQQVNIVFDKIEVKTIDTSSGIFLGNVNNAHGWSSQTKSNYGFGKAGEHCKIEKNVTLIIDDDFIDSPMEDRRMTLESYHEDPGNSTFIHLSHINVQDMAINASVAVGESNQGGWGTQSKNNFGNGKFSGDSLLTKNVNVIKDDDQIDSPIRDQTISQAPICGK